MKTGYWKKITALLCAAALIRPGCGAKAKEEAPAQETAQPAAEEQGTQDAAAAQDAAAQAESTEEKPEQEPVKVRHEDGYYYIGILQQADHESLTRAVEGFMAGMEEYYDENVVFDYRTADGTREDCDRIVKTFISDKDDMIIVAGTRALESAADATTTIPIIGLAVTDFIMCGAVSSYSEPDRNVTGISDLPPMQTTKEVLESFVPEGGKVGFVLSSDEVNSAFQCGFVEEYLTEDGVSYGEYLVDSDAAVEEVLRKASAECSVLYLPADNRLAVHMDLVKKVSLETKVPVMTSDEWMCRNGGLITVTIDMDVLGRRASEMAYNILEYAWMAKLDDDEYDDRGDITMMSVDRVRDTMAVKYNPEMADALGWTNSEGYAAVEMPESYEEAAPEEETSEETSEETTADEAAAEENG